MIWYILSDAYQIGPISGLEFDVTRTSIRARWGPPEPFVPVSFYEVTYSYIGVMNTIDTIQTSFELAPLAPGTLVLFSFRAVGANGKYGPCKNADVFTYN